MTDVNLDLFMENLEQAVVGIIKNQKTITKELINKTVMMLALSFPMLTQEYLEKVIIRIETRCSFTMGIGGSLVQDYTPWFDEIKANIDWYHWPKYRDLLDGKGFGLQVISSLDNVTDRILSLAENPKKEGTWERKGMVVGHVQSGKTANYLGLISKAADAGYKVFIVIAGITNELRKQTQMRIEQGFTGYDTSDTNREAIGIGLMDNTRAKPITFTTVHKDFNRSTASQVGASIQSFSVPVIFVIKKGATVLQNLIDWLQQSKQSNDDMARIDDVPMMLIDDEADNASVNTKRNPDEATKINYLIRQLLNQFNKKCYIGYTATPFANIFIDDANIEGIGGDLFPRDFIYCLDVPSNYCGANKIFGTDHKNSIIRIIDDHQDEKGESGLLPSSHKKDIPVESLPQTLIDAVNMFFLVHAIRILRGDGSKHNSMLVNVSRFNDVQKKVRDKLIEYLTEAQNTIRYSYKMKESINKPIIARLKKLFDAEYLGNCGFSWEQVLDKLNVAVAPIKVYTINQSSGDSLDYENYQGGLNIIAVGGLALSRGLTLEGLSISYIIRNTMMYDTLMQMGRWFGYRDGYEDLCRIYMPKESEDWYKSITEATNELIADFQYMARLNATPKNFGLRVKQSPFNLLITAKNKMWHGTSIREKVDLSGRYEETKRVFITPDVLAKNQKVFYNTVEKLQSITRLSKSNGDYLWCDVPADIVLDFVRDYQNHDSSIGTQMPSMHRFINHIREKDNINLWDVVLVSLDKLQADNQYFDLPIENSICIIPPIRTAGKLTADGKGIEVSSRRRMASQGIEKVGLTDTQIAVAEASDRYRGDKDGAYREVRTKPLLVLFLANLEKNGDTYNQVPVYGISFPYIIRDYEYMGEEYVANAQWIKENYGLFEDDDEDEYERGE